MTAEAISEDWVTPPGGWTTDDLDELPEDGRRRELIDGVLIVPPSPTVRHQSIAARLVVALDDLCPPEYVVTQAVDVRVGRKNSYSPDVLVVTADAAARNASKLRPSEVVLAVEIVSPSSIRMDTFLKPALYAQAGAPYYWRVETDSGITVHTYRLGPAEAYEQTGSFTDAIELDEPWPIRLPIATITPRAPG